MIRNKQLALAVNLPDDETFDSYQGETNRIAAQQLKDFVLPTRHAKQINSFYLFGLPGVGKSHLLHACSNLAADYQLSSLTVSFGEIKNLPVEMLEGLENIDVVCLDDINLIVGHLAWEQAVFDLFNRMIEHNKRLIFTSNESVKQLNFVLPDLASRLTWGLTEQLKPLSDDEKMHAFCFRAQQRGLILQDDAVKFLFTHYSRDMKGVIECLDTLDKMSIQEQRKITIPFIKSVLLT